MKVVFDYVEGRGLGQGGTATLYIDGEQVAGGRIEKTVPFGLLMSGKTFDIEVAPILNALLEEQRDKLLAAGMGHAALATQ